GGGDPHPPSTVEEQAPDGATQRKIDALERLAGCRRAVCPESVESLARRHPVRAPRAVLQEVVDGAASQAVGGAIAHEAAAIEAGETAGGAEPEETVRVGHDLTD